MGVTSPAPVQSMLCESFQNSIQAARDGQGIALGWGHLVAPMLDKGALVRPLSFSEVRPDAGHFLICGDMRKSFPERDQVKRWLVKECAVHQ